MELAGGDGEVEELGPGIGDALEQGMDLDELAVLPGEVGAGAGPGPVFGPLGETGAEGVGFEVAGGGEKVRLVHDAGGEPALPEEAAPVFAEVDGAAVSAVEFAEASAEGIEVAGHGDEVDVVGHQAIGPDLDAPRGQIFRGEIEVELVNVIGEEGLHPPVPALGDVMRNPRRDHSGDPGHVPILIMLPE